MFLGMSCNTHLYLNLQGMISADLILIKLPSESFLAGQNMTGNWTFARKRRDHSLQGLVVTKTRPKTRSEGLLCLNVPADCFFFWVFFCRSSSRSSSDCLTLLCTTRPDLTVTPTPTWSQTCLCLNFINTDTLCNAEGRRGGTLFVFWTHIAWLGNGRKLMFTSS